MSDNAGCRFSGSPRPARGAALILAVVLVVLAAATSARAGESPASRPPERGPEVPASQVLRDRDLRAERAQIRRLFREFQLAAQDQNLKAINRLLSPRITGERRRKLLTEIRKGLWVPMYRRYRPRLDDALEKIRDRNLVEGKLAVQLTIETATGKDQHDEFELRREAGPGGKEVWCFTKVDLENPDRGEYLTLPPAQAERIARITERFLTALEEGDPQAAFALASPRLSEKEYRNLVAETEERFLSRYRYVIDTFSGRARRDPDSVHYVFVVSQEKAPGSIFRYYGNDQVAVPINLYYLEGHGVWAQEKVKKYALVFRWEPADPSATGPGALVEKLSVGSWELVNTTRRDKGFWQGVGKVVVGIGKGTVHVLGNLAPAYFEVHIRDTD